MGNIIILGGSFNPVHIGHMRLAIEAKEAFQASRVDFIPCYNPPHKPTANLLPFELRVEALKRAIAGPPQLLNFEINQFEASFDLPSYTIYTLEHYRAREPEAELWFVIGLSDYLQLPSWFRWQDLTNFANLAVVPRHGHEQEIFTQTTRKLWPQSQEGSTQINGLPGPFFYTCSELKKENWGKIQFLPLPRLDISSSLIRKKWLKGESLDYLLPENVQRLLQEHEISLHRYWQH